MSQRFKAFFNSDDSITLVPDDGGGFAGCLGGVAILLVIGALFLDLLSLMVPYLILIYLSKKVKPLGRGALILAVGTAVCTIIYSIVPLFAIFTGKDVFFAIILMQIIGIIMAIYALRTSVKFGNKAKHLEVTSENPENHRSDLCDKAKKISVVSVTVSIISFLLLIVLAAIASS